MEPTYVIYRLPVDPLALARHRHGRGRGWDSQKQEKLAYGLLLNNAHGDRPLYEGPLHLDINFYLKAPDISLKKAQSREGLWHVNTPDVSNLLKFLEDVGSGVIYGDDRTICSVWPQKRWSATPRIEFTVWELSNPAHQHMLKSAGRYRPSEDFLTNKHLLEQEILFLQECLKKLQEK
jgi:Holliday junction resolvase RusA-like endonuclease